MFSNFMFQEEFAKNFKKLLFKKGIINVEEKSPQFSILQKNKNKVYKKIE